MRPPDATPTTLTAPAFADNTGDDQDWDEDVVIAAITVPAATGNPTPTYAAEGSLPAGIAFNAGTRVISGTAHCRRIRTITVRATNSEGTADWTVDYTITAAPPPTTTTTYEVRVKATANGFTDSAYAGPITIDV